MFQQGKGEGMYKTIKVSKRAYEELVRRKKETGVPIRFQVDIAFLNNQSINLKKEDKCSTEI